ncbi:YcfA-like protein [Sphingomonas sp. MM-1]|uniref:YceI family protein n=1 Tax=Sphingomonas sp. MM-1 TaxID=745310 RepID=UPI0002C0EFEA|nr:YceI family protein [Sphingomonas sp. MM-1]AGH51237.1 YcfA-like protein [Sphingomonas sp. MM-1]
MEPARYSRIAITLHWLIAAALAFQIGLGWRMGNLTAATGQFTAFQLHKSIGITILLLSLIRVAVRWWKPRPAAEPDSPWAKRAAGLVHFGLYAFMIGGPITGWLLVSTSRIQVPTLLFSTIPWPHIPGLHGALRGPVHEFSEAAHSALAWIGIALFVLHVAGALRHQWLLRQPLIERMLPAGPERLSRGGGALAYIAALALVGGAFLLPGTIGSTRGNVPPPAPAAAETPAGETAGDDAGEGNGAIQAAPAEAPDNAATTAGDNASVAAAPAEEAKAEAPRWAVQPGGRLGFTASFTGTPIEGRFTRWDADIRFDADALDKSDIRVRIDMASADTEDSSRDETLRGDAFFDTGAHAAATFRATRVTSTGPARYRAQGSLTIKGVKRPMTVDFTLAIKGDRADVAGKGTITRGDFGIGTGEWEATDRIAGPVAVDFRFSAIRKD